MKDNQQYQNRKNNMGVRIVKTFEEVIMHDGYGVINKLQIVHTEEHRKTEEKETCMLAMPTNELTVSLNVSSFESIRRSHS